MNINPNTRLPEIAKVFLKLGSISFGGPAAHIAMMEEEVVNKKKWMSREHFLDLVGVTNLIPGPNSSEMAMHCGQEQGGWKGLAVAGTAFVLPAVLITSVFAFLYERYGELPNVAPFIFGIKPAVIAIILAAIWNLGKKALKSIELGILGGITLLACLVGLNEIAALFGCGIVGILLYWVKIPGNSLQAIIPFTLVSPLVPDLSKIFWIFLKIGAILYGSGYVLFAFLDSELVVTGLLSRQVLIDSVAAGQFTPGPVLSTATFIGWQLGGITGAAAATIGIFLPSFLLVYFLNPIVPKLRKSKIMAAFLNAVNIASVAIILAVCIQMGREAVTDWRSLAIALSSLALLLVFKKLNSAFVVLGGAVAGYLLLLL